MRHKLILICIYALCFQCLLAKDLSSDSSSVATISQAPHPALPGAERLNQLPGLLRKVPSDTAERVVKSAPPNFQNKYIEDSDFDYKTENKPNSFWLSLKKNLNKLVRKLLGYAPNVKPNYTDILIKTLSGLVLAVAVFFGVRIYMRHKGKWLFNNKNEELPLNVHNSEKLIQSANFVALIADAEKEKNTRLSIRLYYLWLLKSLKDKEVIRWLPDKTNSEYICEIGDPKLRNQFSQLSYLYEYVWYGEFTISNIEYMKAKEAFVHFLEKEVGHHG